MREPEICLAGRRGKRRFSMAIRKALIWRGIGNGLIASGIFWLAFFIVIRLEWRNHHPHPKPVAESTTPAPPTGIQAVVTPSVQKISCKTQVTIQWQTDHYEISCPETPK
jgi:hypothetical protein